MPKSRATCSRFVVYVCILFGGAARSALAQPVIPQGGEFQVNRYTFLNQVAPAVAADADGDFVVTWTDDALDGSSPGIFGLRFSSAGAVLGVQFQVNTYTTSIQRFSAVAAESNGDFVVVWHSLMQDGVTNYSIFGQRFSSSGGTLGGEFRVNSYTVGYQRYPKVAADSDGDFVVVWDSLGQDGSFLGIFGQRFNSSGAALAAEFQINSYTPGNQRFPAVAIDGDGDFVVVWDSFGDSSGYGVFAQRFNSAGTRVGIQFLVNSHTSDSQSRPAVAAEADGDFVVVWQSLHQDGPIPYGNLGIFGRRFSSAGAALGGEFQANSFTLNYQRYPKVAIEDASDFVVAWESRNQDGSYQGVFLRRFNAAGVAQGLDVQANSYTVGSQGQVAIDFDADGDFVVVWRTTEPQDGNAAGIFAQRYSLPPLATLDIDGNGTVDALTDGLLVLRDLFGFGGTTLTAGAVGGGCSRCDAAAISPYRAGIEDALDIDDNGATDALTDGLLVLRYLYGFGGTTLTTG
ncbi:MAG TPA: hypothetical protein VNB06_04475, partial [Thermoanaerobaculia bacterium]|nr:hypothetical protein [Thermoanaerobaculia bacterium]